MIVCDRCKTHLPSDPPPYSIGVMGRDKSMRQPLVSVHLCATCLQTLVPAVRDVVKGLLKKDQVTVRKSDAQEAQR